MVKSLLTMKPKLTDAERKIRRAATLAKYRASHQEKLKADRTEWYKANPTYNASYYSENTEGIKRRTAKYAKENPEQVRAYAIKWAKANPDKVRAKNSAWQKANPEKMKAYGASYRARHPAKTKAKDAAFRLANPDKRAAFQAKRTANKLKATPAWADLAAINTIYQEAARLGLEVDHIVPLQGRTVCGLHVSHNLQLLTKSENSRKSNYHPE